MTQYDVWKAINDNGGTATIPEIMKLTGNGRSSVEAKLPYMRRAGYIRRVKPGLYAVAGPAPERNCYRIVNGIAVKVD